VGGGRLNAFLREHRGADVGPENIAPKQRSPASVKSLSAFITHCGQNGALIDRLPPASRHKLERGNNNGSRFTISGTGSRLSLHA
jgi:hypothetical protein